VHTKKKKEKMNEEKQYSELCYKEVQQKVDKQYIFIFLIDIMLVPSHTHIKRVSTESSKFPIDKWMEA